MSVEPLAVGLVAAIAIALVLTRVSVVRHVARTAVDVVDASLLLYVIRDLLGLSTTTARERRIAHRRAWEQAELERRIGAIPLVDAAPVVPVSRPTRLVVSGDVSAAAGRSLTDKESLDETATSPAVRGHRSAAAPRGRMWRDAVAVVALGAIVVLVVATVAVAPDGDVLGATGSPERLASPGASGSPAVGRLRPAASDRAGNDANVASPAAPVEATPTASAGPSPTAPAQSSADPVAPSVVDPTHRLAGRTDGGRTVAVDLSWAAGGASDGEEVAVAAYILEVSVDDGRFRRISLADATATSARQSLAIGRRHQFRIRAEDAAGRVGEATLWSPITPARHQEMSSLARFTGAWRQAEGPSLSGGGVRFTAARDARFTFRFTGTDVAWVATRTPSSGRARVIIDGEAVATVDLAASSVEYRRLVFRRHFATGKARVLEIRPFGDGRVDVDALIVLR